MALLATKRFLRKSEIFTSVDGYEGSPESKERMFERDKTELRALGLEIEVGNDEPLFEDEAGYRINPKNYSLDLGELDQTDIALLSLAGSTWQNSLLSESAQSALRKVEALYGAIDRASVDLVFMQQESAEESFADMWKATTEHREVTFSYRSQSLTKRNLRPYTLFLSNGRWYVVGFDVNKAEIRQFKIARIASESISLGKKFDPPEHFDLQSYLRDSQEQFPEYSLEILVRKGRAQEIRSLARATEFDDDWDSISLKVRSLHETFELLSRCAESAKIQRPYDVQKEFISWIEAKRHV